MRNIRLRHQFLPRNREKGASAAIQCQQTYSSRSVDSSNPMTTHEYAPTVVGLSPSSVGTKLGAYPRPDALLAAKEPVLLLEGDNYRFSASGIARSLYQLTSEHSATRGFGIPNSLAIEEIYDIGRARKGFVIRQKTMGINGMNLHSNPERILPLDDASPPITLLLQEISHEVEQSGAGTGSRTWESSIAMSAYFASKPDLLMGNVIEIGSGVGLGGILSFLFRSLSPSTMPFHSMTLSDCKLQVLNHCDENVRSFLKSYPSFSSISVAELDWYDILQNTAGASKHAKHYDTVIACDCAYDYTDIEALVGTLKGLLKKKQTSKAHIFGPSSRGGLHKLISQLREEACFCIEMENIEMVRYRLDPPREKHSLRSLEDLRRAILPIDDNSNSKVHSKFDSEFLHVTCSLRLDSEAAIRKEAPLRDID
mmetsp:Transcript_8937/g.22110  ORF Transcript_8937/g.22110 Transcript_8937/m.22110 type:complete len:425 (+) Transcript_8937:126-1400(+)